MARIRYSKMSLLLQGAPPHIHRRELETFIVLEGEYEFQCGDRKFKATKGAIVVLPREVPHAFKNTGNTKARLSSFWYQVGWRRCSRTSARCRRDHRT